MLDFQKIRLRSDQEILNSRVIHMKVPNSALISDLAKQIAMEEEFCFLIEKQILEVDGAGFEDAKQLLIGTKEILRQHFISLNQMLDNLEGGSGNRQSGRSNGLDHKSAVDLPVGEGNSKISKMLREDYIKLNEITMHNTVLHAKALALDFNDVAMMALRHLGNLAAVIIKLGELTPEIVAREISNELPGINPEIGGLVVNNIREAWKKLK